VGIWRTSYAKKRARASWGSLGGVRSELRELAAASEEAGTRRGRLANPGAEAHAEGGAAAVWGEVSGRHSLSGAGGVGLRERPAAEWTVSDAWRAEHGAADSGRETEEPGGGAAWRPGERRASGRFGPE
jgi:hypothetical protein